MRMKEIKTRVPDDIAEKLEEVAKKRNTSVSEVVREIIVRYMAGEQVDDIPVRVITHRMRASKETQCPYCNIPIKPGEWIFYVIKEFEDGRVVKEAWHEDCWRYGSDRTLARLYVEIRKLMRTRNALKRECDKYADLIIEAEARKKIYDAALEIQRRLQDIDLKLEKAMKTFMEFAQVDFSGAVKQAAEDVKSIISEIQRLREEAVKKIDEALMYMQKPRRKKAKIEEVGAEWKT